jgi:hypothetical protein
MPDIESNKQKYLTVANVKDEDLDPMFKEKLL